MKFTKALENLMNGKSIFRPALKGLTLVYLKGYEFPAEMISGLGFIPTDVRKTLKSRFRADKKMGTFQMFDPTLYNTVKFPGGIHAFSITNVLTPYTPTTNDLEATDWEVCDAEGHVPNKLLQ